MELFFHYSLSRTFRYNLKEGKMCGLSIEAGRTVNTENLHLP